MANHLISDDLADRTLHAKQGAEGLIFRLKDGQFSPNRLGWLDLNHTLCFRIINPFLNLRHKCAKGWAALMAPREWDDFRGVCPGLV